MRIAVLADVHGNLHALRALTAALRRHAPDAIVNLGDLVSGPFDPAGSADAQRALCAATLMGDQDRWVLGGGTGRPEIAHAVRTGRVPEGSR